MTTESPYYLQMKDDFGHTYSSPIFNIACEHSFGGCAWPHFSDHAIIFCIATPQKKSKPAAHQPDVAQPRPDQAPMSSSPSSSSSPTGTKPKGVTDSNPPADPHGILLPPSAASLSPPNAAATLSPGSSNNGAGGSGPQVAAAAHNAPPAAAIAVPLSLTGAIILLAGGLALHHRKQLAAEKERAWSSSSWPWNKDGRSPGLAAAEKALFARTLFRGGASLPEDDVYHHGCFPEKAATSLYSPYCAPSSSSYACCAPEPRQRTRELDLLTREFTTRPRPRAHPSASPSSYRGFWDRRYTLRRSTRSTNDNNNNNGGGGSLWRSISFAARQKKVLPPIAIATTPPLASALNSPAMTVVTTSVTSEVLPSYLPSPQFDGPATADQAYASSSGKGDFGFENVPLSPPQLPLPPPPLHTRGEAAVDPEDSRMKELRGVYEAVARALGSTHGV